MISFFGTDQGVQYDTHGRMRYHPDYHQKHRTPWTYADEKYLMENYVIDGPETVSLALGRTIKVVMSRVYCLRKEGKMPKAIPGAKKHKRMKTL